MNRTFKTPLFVLFGIIVSCVLMAGTNIFDPLVHYIHTGVITPLQAVVCLVFTVAGFAACYGLLNLLCSYFVPRIDAHDKRSKNILSTKPMEGN